LGSSETGDRRAGWRETAIALAVFATACLPGSGDPLTGADRQEADPELLRLRERMVESQIRSRGVADERVLAAMESVPRHRFVPPALSDAAYRDHPLPIGLGQTISQPYIVALMTEALRPQPDDRILEIGTGSGYQAAVLSLLVAEVYSIEIVEELAATSSVLLQELGYRNVRVRHGDGYRGWPEQAPFDGIIVTAAPGHVPQPLVEQLRPGGRMVIPVGEDYQELKLIQKTESGTRESVLIPVRFVPMTGEAQQEHHPD
jgi:protein-L-isoaspartate(D-aspartate) O-methyltransferase